MLPIEDNVPIPGKENAAGNGSPTDNDPLAAPGKRAELARQILADIDAYCEDKYNDGHRKHLGASLIGHECSRYLWNVFRWLKAERFTGRQLRLFQRGHLEEARFEEYLRGIGAEVVAFQPLVLHYHAESESYFYGPTFDPGDGLVEDVTGVPEHEAAAHAQGAHLNSKGANQYRISAVFGHFGGSLDGQVMLPEKYGVPFGFLSEYKTKGTGRGFSELKEKGVKLTNPVHYAQMSMYGRAYGYKYAIYMSVNKNDDDLHVEVVELDWTLGEQLERKATDVITSQVPPQKIAETPAYTKCKFCHFSGICHNGDPVEKNCRSCTQAKPVDGGQWYCARFNDVIPSDFIAQGCDQHNPIA